jgi:hypothetical protein
MATLKQIEANRRNAQLSTGPRTEQGKAVSRMNAIKTGIDARNEVSSGEDPAALAELAATYDHEFQPLGVVERFLVDILIKDDWFLRRYRFLAADLINHTATVAYESKRGADFGAGFAANTASFQRLHRHIVETERSFFTHLAELERRQATRRHLQAEAGAPVAVSPSTENPEIGFVPQPAPAARQTPTPSGRTTPSPHSSNPEFGFVPHSHRPIPPRPDLPSTPRPGATFVSLYS